MFEQFGWFALGLFLVAIGADSLVKGAAGLALRAGLSAFVVGLVVVGFGSAVPETSVSFAALGRDADALALGNLVGSNLANLGVVLGGAALFAPLAVRGQWVRYAWGGLLLATLVAWGLAFDGALSAIDGAILLAGIVVVWVFMGRASRREPEDVRVVLSHAAATHIDLWRNLLRIAIGLVALYFGATYTVDAALALALGWGLSELVAGLTFVAVANAMPELVAALVAAKRGHGELVVGAVLGSSLVNGLVVLGLLAVAGGAGEFPKSLVQLELPALAAFTLALHPMMRSDLRISRNEGGILLGAFLLLLGWQLWRVAA